MVPKSAKADLGTANRKSTSPENALATPQHLPEYFLDRVRRNSKLRKSGHVRRCHGVDLHQLHLIASERRTREHFRNPCQCVPGGKRERHQSGIEAGFVRNGSEQLLVRVNAIRTESSCLRRCPTTRRPRKPVPPNTVTTRMLMARTCGRSCSP